MKKYNIYTYYDTNKTIIGKIIPNVDSNGDLWITTKTYNKLLRCRTIGGDAGIYAEGHPEISVYNSVGDCVKTIH